MRKITLLLVVMLILTACGDVKENEVVNNQENSEPVVDLQNDEYEKTEPDIEEKKEDIDKAIETVLPEVKPEEETKIVLESVKEEI